MSISGELKTMHLAEILQWCKNGGKTGTLSLSRRGVTKKIYVEKGTIVSAASNDPHEYLGQHLVSQGKASEDDLNLAFEIQGKTKILLGKILVARKIIGEKDLQKLLRAKVHETIFNLFLWQEGNFSFSSSSRLAAKNRRVEIGLNIDSCILEGAKRVDEWKRWRALFPYDGTTFSLTEKKLPPAAKDSLQRRLIALLGEGKSIEEMALELHTHTFPLLSLLFELHSKGCIKIAGKKAPRKTGAGGKGAGGKVSEKEEERLLSKRFLPAAKVPALLVDMAEINLDNFSPREAFLLSRINGQWDIKTIAMISPMKKIETLRILKKFLDEKILSLA